MARNALVIDDSRAMRTIIGNILKEMGYHVTDASNGIEGLERLKEVDTIELVLVDWNMPEMNGLEFVMEVRTIPEYKDLCLMMVTTEIESEQVNKALSAGANEYVMKPFTKDVILEKLNLLGIETQ